MFNVTPGEDCGPMNAMQLGRMVNMSVDGQAEAHFCSLPLEAFQTVKGC